MTFASYIRRERIFGVPHCITVATGNIDMKTSQEQKKNVNHLYELFLS